MFQSAQTPSQPILDLPLVNGIRTRPLPTATRTHALAPILREAYASTCAPLLTARRREAVPGNWGA
jgi:hypothetical protein